MTKSLAKLDLNRLHVDEKTFLGRVLELGIRLGRFREPFQESLIGYLQSAAIQHAQRYRKGIKAGKEDLAKGIKRAAVCLDAGLDDESQGDLNTAIDLLRPDRFESIRMRGWENVHRRLTEMGNSAGVILRSNYTGLLEGEIKRLRRWTTIRPDDCSAVDDDGQREDLDLLQEFEDFLRVEWHARFIGSLPRALLDRLPEAVRRSWGFDQVVTAVVHSLATDHPDLLLNDEAERRLTDMRGADGILTSEVQEKVERLLRAHILADHDDSEYIAYILNAGRKVFERVEKAGC